MQLLLLPEAQAVEAAIQKHKGMYQEKRGSSTSLLLGLAEVVKQQEEAEQVTREACPLGSLMHQVPLYLQMEGAEIMEALAGELEVNPR